MDEILEDLWTCPICSAEHSNPVILCCRCKCQILLLNKIKFTALYFKKIGYEELSKKFYDKEF